MDAHGEPKTEAEKQAWSDSLEAARPYDNEEKKEWFIGICTRTLRVLFFGPPPGNFDAIAIEIRRVGESIGLLPTCCWAFSLPISVHRKFGGGNPEVR